MIPLRLVLVGLGARGRYWQEVVRRSDTCEAVGFCDPSPEARSRAAALEPGVPTFDTLEAALARVQADALVLATPPDTRAAHIALACDRGLSLLVEKPLALELETARRYTDMAERAGVPLMVGLNFRYLHVTRVLRTLFSGGSHSGPLGAPLSARFTYERRRDPHAPHLNKYPITIPHPMLWEQSVHHFDLLRFVYGLEPTWVSCRTWNPPGSPYAGDANVSALFTFEGGLEVSYLGTWWGSWRVPHFEWRTDAADGVALQRDQFGTLAYARSDAQEPTPVPLPPHETWVTDTEGVLAAFVRTLREGAPLECSARDHLRSLVMVAACIRSSATGQSVPLSTTALEEAPMV